MGRRRLRIVTSDSDDDDFAPTPQTAVPNPPPPLQPENIPFVISDDDDESFVEAADVFSPPLSPRPHLPAPAIFEADEAEFAAAADAFSPALSSGPPPAPDGASTFEGDDAEFMEAPNGFSPPLSSRPAPSREAPAPIHSQGPAAPFPPQAAQRSEAPPRSWAVEECLRVYGLRLRGEWLETCLDELQRSRPGFGGLGSAAKAKLCFERFMFADMNACGGGVLPENVQALHDQELEGPFVLQVDEIINISAPLRDRYRDAPACAKRCLKLLLTDGLQQVFGMEYRPIKELDVLAPAGLKVVIRNVFVRHGMLLLVPEIIKVLGGVVEDLDLARQRLVQEVNKPPRGRRSEPTLTLAERALRAAWPSNSMNNTAQENISDPSPRNIPASFSSVVTAESLPDVHTGRTATEEFVQVVSHDPPGPTSRTERRPIREIRTPSQRTTERPVMQVNGHASVARASPPGETTRSDYRLEPGSLAPTNFCDDVHGLAAGEVQRPTILNGSDETPFTYMACLLARWTSVTDSTPHIQGKVKCFLTGVKGFQFRNRNTYELCAYVDDGSLICEVLVDHNFVERAIGHSPLVVTAALASPQHERVSEMKEKLKRFQKFLTNFEGTMLMELNRDSSLPIAREMNQGCSVSDIRSLIRRLKTLSGTCLGVPINLSP